MITWTLCLHWLCCSKLPKESWPKPLLPQDKSSYECVLGQRQEQIPSLLSSLRLSKQTFLLLMHRPYFTKLPFIQKYLIEPLRKQLVSLLWRGLDFTGETSQAVNWDRALPLPKLELQKVEQVYSQALMHCCHFPVWESSSSRMQHNTGSETGLHGVLQLR